MPAAHGQVDVIYFLYILKWVVAYHTWKAYYHLTLSTLISVASGPGQRKLEHDLPGNEKPLTIDYVHVGT